MKLSIHLFFWEHPKVTYFKATLPKYLETCYTLAIASQLCLYLIEVVEIYLSSL